MIGIPRGDLVFFGMDLVNYTCMCMNVSRERHQMSLAVGNLLLSAWNQGV